MYCKKCGNEIGEKALYCPDCGTKQVPVYTKIFERDKMSETEFIEEINTWFNSHTNAINISCNIDTKNSFGLLVNKYKLKQITIKYEMSEFPCLNQYCFVKESKYTLFEKKVENYVAEWEKANSNVAIVTWHGGSHMRGQLESFFLKGFGAFNRVTAYILFKYPRT